MSSTDPTGGLPRVLSDFQPASALFKADYEDFIVEEVPLYAAAGRGPHTYFLLEKRGLSTMHAVQDIARALNARRRDIGYAGLKDARAVTRQWMSIEHVEPQRLRTLKIPRMRVLAVTSHKNKLRLGHLRGNRFVIKARQTEPHRLAELQGALAKLAKLGVPNYFGEQRFGGRGDTWAVGRAIVRDDPAEALDLVLGRPNEFDQGGVRRARQLYELGRYREAAKAWPGMFREERRALKALQRARGTKQRAFLAIDRTVRRFYISAYQSHLFNRVLQERLPLGLDRLLMGDLAWLHDNGAAFEVTNAQAEQPRADAFEISPSGPLFGYRMTQPGGRPAEIEAAVLASDAADREAFYSGRLRVKGGRRPLRFQPANSSIQLGADARGAYLALRFTLPRGCYATALLRELFG